MKLFKININGHRLVVHKVDISNYRLVQLTDLANQAKPVYDWIEREAQDMDESEKSLNYILFHRDSRFIRNLIMKSFNDNSDNLPQLLDGAGRIYPHKKAVFYFFAWMIRDAPQQRLNPLISRMLKLCKNVDLKRPEAQADAISRLFVAYRDNVKSFSWDSIREVVINRLEGSRRSLRGHHVENLARQSVAKAVQTFYNSHLDYGMYKDASIRRKQIKLGNDTVDITVDLERKDNGVDHIYIPVKSRETEGGGHSHLFSRDIMTAINDIKRKEPSSHFGVIIVANNWNDEELDTMSKSIDFVFQFSMSPDDFKGFDESSQKILNKVIKGILTGNENSDVSK